MIGHRGADFESWPRCHCQHPDGECRTVADFRATFTYPTYAGDGTYEDEPPRFYCRECLAGMIEQKARYRRIDIIPLRPK